jgi:hypothetical protein
MHEISKAKRDAIYKSTAAYIDIRGGKVVVPQEVWLYMVMKS